MADQTGDAISGVQAYFWQLRGLSGPGFAANDDNLMFIEGGNDRVAMREDGQILAKIGGGQSGPSLLDQLDRRVKLLFEFGEKFVVRFSRLPRLLNGFPFPPQRKTVAEQRSYDLLSVWSLVAHGPCAASNSRLNRTRVSARTC